MRAPEPRPDRESGRGPRDLFLRLVAGGGTELVDAAGRPLGEVASRRYPALPTREARCPYSGPRRGGTMNATALDSISRRWPRLLARLGAMQGGDATVAGAWRACAAAATEPLRWDLRSPGLPVPVETAALYKLTIGFAQVLTFLLLADDGVADAPLASLGDADAFVAELDAAGWLVGDRQVCAGTAPMIASVFRSLAAPPSVRRSDDRGPPDAVGLLVGVGLATVAVERAGDLDRDRLGPRLLADGVSPFLAAVVATPGRRPEHLRRLFARGSLPGLLQRFLAQPLRTHHEVERAASRALVA